jgi:hypothetical protein
MALAARRPVTARAAGLTNERLMQLVRFPYVRKAISSALERAVPEKVEAGHGGAYVRFRVADPRSFHPALFATIPVGQRGTLLVIGTPKSEVRKPVELAAFLKRMGRGLRAEARRSLIYQLRTAGIIGGSRTQAVLVPRNRVAQVAGKFAASSSGRRAAANPILATIGFNPRRPKAVPGIAKWHMYAGGTGAVEGKHGFSLFLSVGRYMVQPFTTRYGRHAGYLVYFINEKGATTGGLWQELGIARSPEAGATMSRTHFARTFPGAAANPLTTKESVDLVRFAKYMAESARKAQLAGRSVEAGWKAGEARGVARSVQRYGIKRAGRAADRISGKAGDTAMAAGLYRTAANPGTGMVQIRIPFREGQHVTTQNIEAWIASLPHGAFRRAYESRFTKAKGQYQRFHLGSLPPYWKFTAFGFGANSSITDVDFVVSEGKEWAAPYQVSPRSGKYDPKVQGRYIHAHGDSKMEIDIKRAASTKKLPERFHTADGKFVGVIPSKNVKITDWYRG